MIKIIRNKQDFLVFFAFLGILNYSMVSESCPGFYMPAAARVLYVSTDSAVAAMSLQADVTQIVVTDTESDTDSSDRY